MPIARRVPEVTKDIANHLRQIEVNGWPKNYAVAKKFEPYIGYGWVSPGGKLTEKGERVMYEYFETAKLERREESPYNRVQPSAR